VSDLGAAGYLPPEEAAILRRLRAELTRFAETLHAVGHNGGYWRGYLDGYEDGESGQPSRLVVAREPATVEQRGPVVDEPGPAVDEPGPRHAAAVPDSDSRLAPWDDVELRGLDPNPERCPGGP
jgi:hypothetical protein